MISKKKYNAVLVLILYVYFCAETRYSWNVGNE